jgi:hypothetical protein
MMDTHGIGYAMEGMVQIYMHTARATGRTVSMIAELQEHDVVIFIDAREAKRVKRMAADMGIEINTHVVPVEQPERLMDRRPNRGRTLFDHSWVEKFYQHRIAGIGREFNHWQSMLNDNREPPITDRARMEQRKWPFE